jgi:hypothetical protein
VAELLLRILVRLLFNRFGLAGTLAAVLLLALLGSSVVGAFVLMFFGCAFAGLGLFAVDVATASSSRATVTGHHWERKIYPEEAELGSDGRIRWDQGLPISREGDDLNPVWPVVPDDRCTTVGCRRPGRKVESYALDLRLADGRAEDCPVDAEDWPRFAVGSGLTVEIGGVTGNVMCRGSTPEAAPAAPSRPAPAPRSNPGKAGKRR